MTDHKYPIAPTTAPRFDIGLYVAVCLEEMGFPPVVGEDRDRLDAALNDFLYKLRGEPPMTRIECLLGQEPVYVGDWTVETDGELRSGVVVKVDAEEEVIVDFSPTQARVFGQELISAACRAIKAAPIEARPR